MKKQDKTKLIQTIIGSYLLKKGFRYVAYDASAWIYERKEGEVIQTILVNEYGKMLRLDLIANGIVIFDKDLIPEAEYRGNILRFWEYDNQEEFVNILGIYVKALEDKGIEALFEISQSSAEIKPTPEMNRYLYDNHISLAQKYRLKLEISPKQIEPTEAANIIWREMEKLQNRSFEEALPDLIGLAAVSGAVMIECLGGEWEWQEANRVAMVKLPKLGMNPLSLIIYGWRDSRNMVMEEMLGDYKYHKISLEM